MSHHTDAMWRGAGSVQVFRSAQIPWPGHSQLLRYAAGDESKTTSALHTERKFRAVGLLLYVFMQLALLWLTVIGSKLGWPLPVTLATALSPLLIMLVTRWAALRTLDKE